MNVGLCLARQPADATMPCQAWQPGNSKHALPKRLRHGCNADPPTTYDVTPRSTPCISRSASSRTSPAPRTRRASWEPEVCHKAFCGTSCTWSTCRSSTLAPSCEGSAWRSSRRVPAALQEDRRKKTMRRHQVLLADRGAESAGRWWARKGQGRGWMAKPAAAAAVME